MDMKTNLDHLKQHETSLLSERMNAFVTKEKTFGAHNYKPLPVVLAKAQGAHLYDVDGKKYIDMMSAYSAVSHGHSHAELVKTLTQQAQTLCVTSRAYYTNRLSLFLEKLCQMSGFEMALPMNSGAEAVETAIKACRRWGYRVKQIPQNQAEIIVADQNFHGRTTTIVGFSSDKASQADFGPFTPGFKHVPFGDIQALEKAITPNTCAVLFEPIQGEAGIIFPPQGFLKQMRQVCTKHNVLMIMDEIQSGLGRTGRLFAYEHENVKPDGVIVGKALGGGILPVSAFVSTHKIMSLFEPGSHGSTFGGNPLASAVALRALEIIEEEKLCERSAELGEYFKQELKSVGLKGVREIRGLGLWIGLELEKDNMHGRELCVRLLEKGVLTKDTHETTIRLAPPLVIERSDIDFVVQKLKEILNS